jgi:hypothetical protein
MANRNRRHYTLAKYRTILSSRPSGQSRVREVRRASGMRANVRSSSVKAGLGKGW